MKKILLFFFVLLIGKAAFSTHNRAGEIVYKHLYDHTYEVTVIIFSDPTSPAYARKSIEINWGDNTGFDSLFVISEQAVSNRISKRIWVGNHTFPGPGNYVISVTDLNRNGGINNIENSSQVPFYVETLLRISPFEGEENNSVVLLNDPIDEACVGRLFMHNPGAYDPDGDSLAYQLVKSKASNGSTAPGYFFPPASNFIQIDPVNGDLIWDEPTQVGQFNLSILIMEYRNGILISTVLRDMQIDVRNFCTNNPPNIIAADKHCVEAGKNLSFDVQSNDQDAVDLVTLSATGGPFNFQNSPAQFNIPSASNPITGNFSWNTVCEHRRSALYNLSFKAVDNANLRGEIRLSSFKTVDVKIIAPAPINFVATPQNKAIALSWDNSFCPDASGYKLYRRRDSSGFVPDACTMGVPATAGFALIAEINHLDSTDFLDDDSGNGLVPGQKYCYLVVASFPDGDESYASAEVCAQVDKYNPVITQVSVVETSSSTGKIDLRWSPPDTIDTQQFPAPYQYLIYHKTNPSDFILVDSTPSINDTIYQITGINTLEEQHTFKVDLYSMGNSKILVGNSTPASSMFLSINSSDQQLSLNWQNFSVPWNNTEYIVYRKLPSSLVFDPIDTTDSPYYLDLELENGKDYCYYIKSIGEMQLSSVPSPILNLSQQACGIPEDKTPPCPPSFELKADCQNLKVTLEWEIPSGECASDISSLLIYKTNNLFGEPILIETINNIQLGSVQLDSNNFTNYAGCYSITLLDSNGNESEMADSLCVDICPNYKLPNVMTPNGDGHNDYFIPFPYSFVDSIDMTILNRWGQPVFKTQDPDINWDGTHYEENEKVSAGVYFYICKIYENTLLGVRPRILKGTITLIDPKPDLPRK